MSARLTACAVVAALGLAPAGAVGESTPAVSVREATCASTPVPLLSPRVAELVTVIAPRGSATTATLEVFRRRVGCLVPILGPYPARLGYNGLSIHHVEGDGTTPVGLFGFGGTIYGLLPDPGVNLPYRRLVCGSWWDEDPRSAAYNRFVQLSCGATPTFGGNSEALWRAVPAYDYFAVIDYNEAPVVPGRGSGIFLHVDTGSPTDGCVSLPRGELVSVLKALDPSEHPAIGIGTATELHQLRTPANL